MARMDIKILLEELNKELNLFIKQPDKWLEFLKSASWNYKYSFQNQLLIYSQRPDATACADFNVWNTKLHRYVAKGSKGIAILNDMADRVSYVFDVSDTRSSSHDELKLWDIQNDISSGVLDRLNSEHSLACTSIEDVIVQRVNETFADMGSIYLPEGDIQEDREFVNAFNEAVKNSSYVFVLLRCGYYDKANDHSEKHLQNITSVFNDTEKLIALGTAVCSVSEVVLREIERASRAVSVSLQNKNAIKQNDNLEAKENENELQDSRGLSGSGYSSEGVIDREDRENGINETRFSETPKTGSLHHPSDERRIGEPFDGDREISEGSEGSINSELVEDLSGAVESGEFNGLDETHELNSNDGRRNGDAGTDSPLDDVLFPTVEEQLEVIESSTDVSNGFELSQEDIDCVLQEGTGFVHGKFRVYDYFLNKHSAKEGAEFLKNEFGIGGGTRILPDGTWGDAWTDAKGLRISKRGHAMSDPDIILSWTKVQKRIRELIKDGRYLNEKELAEYPAYKEEFERRTARIEIGKEFTDVIQGYNDFLRENNNDNLLDQYVLIVGCCSEFMAGRQSTNLRMKEGEFVLPLMRDALNEIIAYESPFKECAEHVLEALQGDVVKGFEPIDGVSEAVEEEYVLVPKYKVGDLFFYGASKYSIVEISEASVYLSDVEFELSSLELTKEEFEKIVRDNPSNNHLLTKYSVEDYNAQINHAINIIDEVEKELQPLEEPEFEIIPVVQVGDFYEVRGEIASSVAEKLGIKSTRKFIDGEDVDMCGFPVIFLDNFNERLFSDGLVLRVQDEALGEKDGLPTIEVKDVNEKVEAVSVKRNSLIARNHDALYRLAPGVMNGDYTSLEFESKGFEPLIVSDIGDGFISIKHYFMQNGDRMSDPDIVVKLDSENKTVTAATYEMHSMGLYKEYIDFETGETTDIKGQKDTNNFLSQWFKNIEQQHYVLSKGKNRDGEYVYFDKSGREITDVAIEGLNKEFHVRLYRPYNNPDTIKAYVSEVNVSLEDGHIVADEREVFESREAGENAVLNFNTVFEYDEEFRNETLAKVPNPVLHRYYSTQRPVSLGTYPKISNNPPVNIVNYDDRTFEEVINRSVWGYLEFEHPLTLQQAEDYELVKAPFEALSSLLDNEITESSIDEADKVAVRMQLDGNDDSGIFVYIERNDIPCPDSHIELGVFESEDAALKFCSHIDNLLDDNEDYRNQQLLALKSKSSESLQNDIISLKPIVVCNFSEHDGFEKGKEYSFTEFNALMKQLDDEVVKLKAEYKKNNEYYPYFKVDFSVRFPDGREYSGRQDIGDGDGSLLEHIRASVNGLLRDLKADGVGGYFKGDELTKKIRHTESFINVYLPLLESEVRETELSYDKEAYKLGYGSLGNGTTVWNSADIDKEVDDYRTIAHISDDGTVKFYVEGLPEGVKAEIRTKATDFSSGYLNDLVNMPEEWFKNWYFHQMLSHHPSYIPGRDFRVNDYIDCYNALHIEGFERDVDIPLILQLENLSKSISSEASKETRRDIIDKASQGEISAEDIKVVLDSVNATEIQSADDVYEVLADRFSNDASTIEPPVKTSNFKITNLELGVGGPKEKYRNNVAAIKLLNQLESEDRQATQEEQEVLSKYVGWGGLDKAFDVNNSSWAQEYKELQELLTTEEYRSAKASTLTSFYTPPVVIKAIYDGLRKLGFKRGNILEPSCGVGNFFGMMPEEFSDSKLYGVELDSISGRIAKQLYPEAKIAVKGYEDTKFKDSFFDVAIGNVPFGQFKVNDKEYNKHNFLIHDYFFAKTLDKVRPGGVVAFITSKGTLDKQSPEVRRYIAQRAELLGAIRLPNDTFTANAGTKATSDIIFLKKRDKAIDIEPDWVHLGLTENGLPINSYFIEHPEMVLGHMEMERMQHGREDTTCVPNSNTSLKEQLDAAIQNINGKFSEKAVDFEDALENTSSDLIKSLPADPNVRNFSYVVVDGDIYYQMDQEMIKQELNPTRQKRVLGLIEIRDCLRHLIDLQRYDYSDYEIEAEQRKLNELYDKYTAKYGLINSRGNSMAFEDDSSYYLLCSLENVDENGELVSKADMFTKRTIKRHVPVTYVGTPSEALSVSISEKARVDLDFMSDLTDMPKEKIIEDLKGVIFRVPGETGSKGEDVYVTSDEYLSGNVREKLKIAKLAAKTDRSFDVNVIALEAVIPKDLEPHEISLRLGSIWVPEDVVNEFMWDLLDTPKAYMKDEPDVKVHYNEINGSWTMENKNGYNYTVKARSTYGTKRISAYDIILSTLNLKTVEVYDYEYENGKQKRTLNKNETIVAQQKQELIKNEFLNWVWDDPERRQRLVRIYNDKFNSIRLREYNGDHLVFEGMNPEITLMKHQKDAVAHAIYGGNTLLAHDVGAGKTFEMTAIAMECKRLGLCSKSLMVVPNHLIGQWASEFYQLYPSANLLVASKKDFEPANRKKFCSRIATGDYDAIIIGHSQFEKIPLSVDMQTQIIQEEIDEIEWGIRELQAADGNNASIKSLEKTRKTLELRLERLSDIKQDNVLTFEELGVDKIFIDEAHYFKNLFLYTKMHNVAGIAQTEAKKSTDLYMKTRYLNDLTGSKGVVFATGTPISNSMVEMYTMQRYLQYYTLKQNGLLHFDAWASTFGEVVTAVELAPEGTGYRAKTRFAKFYNIPELMSMFKQVADIKTEDDLNIPKPKVNFHVIKTKPSKFQERIVESLGKRAKAVRDRLVEPTEDNMLKITNDGRLLGLDQRCFDETLPDDENSKVNQTVRDIYDIWDKNKEAKLAQLVFCDISTPTSDGFSVYEDVKQKLMAKGIPEKEIAFIHDAKTDVQKDRLFEKVRSGAVRVLMGSTAKMGAGTNVQKKLVAMHDLDCPWRPSDLKQRLGRIARQGNEQSEVDVYRRVTEGTFDAYLWQMIENKQKFISQIWTSKSPIRVADDIDSDALSYAEIKSLCIKDPRIKEKMELDVEVAKLNLVKANFMSQKYRLEDDIAIRYPSSIKRLEQSIIGYKADIEHVADCPMPDDENTISPMVINGKAYTDRKEANKALLAVCQELKDASKVEIGEYRGFKMFVQYNPFTCGWVLNLKGGLTHEVKLAKNGVGNISRMNNAIDVETLKENLIECEQKLADTKSELATAKIEVTKEFAQQEELDSKIARLNELETLLRMDEKGDSQEQNKENEQSDNSLDSVLSDAYSRSGEYNGGSPNDKHLLM